MKTTNKYCDNNCCFYWNEEHSAKTSATHNHLQQCMMWTQLGSGKVRRVESTMKKQPKTTLPVQVFRNVVTAEIIKARVIRQKALERPQMCLWLWRTFVLHKLNASYSYHVHRSVRPETFPHSFFNHCSSCTRSRSLQGKNTEADDYSHSNLQSISERGFWKLQSLYSTQNTEWQFKKNKKNN